MLITALERKMVRDLYKIRGQAFAICLVIAAGIATFVMSWSTLESIRLSKDTYYERYGFADVFAHLKRAPMATMERIRALPGVARAEDRIVFDVTIDVAGMTEPAVGRLISLPEGTLPGLNSLYLRRGRWLTPYRSREVLVAEPFADSHQLKPGDQVVAIINGRRQKLTIVGIVLSPEYLIQINRGNLLPDDRRFGIFYMGYDGLAAALDLEGAFNDVSLKLQRSAAEQEVLKQLDDITEPYGGVGAYGRDSHVSDQYISDEIRQLRSMGLIAPSIFLSVAIFLLNVVASRLIDTQREQVAALKAFGYSKVEIAKHYVQMILVIPLLGTLIGIGAGVWMGHGMATMYARFYRFPVFSFHLDARVVALAFLMSGLAALLGTLAAVRRAVSLAPAEAMRPEPPANYRPTVLERLGLGRLFPQVVRMILRNLERRPVKSAFSVIGIAMAVAVLILGSFMLDALNYIMDFQFRIAQRQDVTITFVDPASSSAIHEVGHFPGVLQWQPFRAVPVRLRKAHRQERTSIMGLPTGSRLFRLVNDREREVQIPPQGLLLSEKLAEQLGAKPGDLITVEVFEGERPVHQVLVASLIAEYSGMNAYMQIDALRTLLKEGDTTSGAFLQVDSLCLNELYQNVKETAGIAAMSTKAAMLQSFQDTVAENLLRMRLFNIMFATIIAFGVVYNSARISLAERTRELSTLRVIGFTRGEISFILLGELGMLTAVAIPLGMLMGYGFAGLATLGLDTEIYRIPLIVETSTFANAALVVLIATISSGLVVRRMLDRLDLVAVLKSKE